MVSGGDYGECLVLCKMKSYRVKRLGTKNTKYDATGFRLLFEREVIISKSALKTNELGFISKLGGDIGLCKNLLWLIIIITSTIGVIYTRFNVGT